jgi:hypothetical protein
LRKSIARKECWCTTEVFMWPSIVFQPPSLARAMIGGRVWKSPSPPRGGNGKKSLPLPVVQAE